MKLPLTILLLFTALSAHAKITDEIDQLVKNEVSSRGFQGNVFVHGPGGVIFAKSYGLADIEFKVPNARNTVFRIGSVSKQFTAVGVLRLFADGKIKNLNDPLGNYLQVPEAWKEITIHQLLTHTAGLQHDPPLLQTAASAYHGLNLLFDSITSVPLQSAPGTTYAYSNAGYEVLAYLIETLSGEPFAEYMATAVFQPAGLDFTNDDSDFEIVPHRARGYLVNQGRLFNQAGFDLSNIDGAGSFISTVDDLYKWDQVLQTEQILPAAIRDLLFQPHVADGPRFYGYGWVIDQWKGHKLIWHNGQINGYASDFARFVDDKLVIVTLSNRYDAGPSVLRIRENIAAAVLGNKTN